MRQPRSYVVRIYRRGFQALSGIVEDAHTGGKRAFRDVSELSELLRGPIAACQASRHKVRSKSTK